ncbi:MAG: hypothetical protein IJ736_12820 [Firmicutes bacterium]|nr:hypothetical protein [Bacillota bacterium]
MSNTINSLSSQNMSTLFSSLGTSAFGGNNYAVNSSSAAAAESLLGMASMIYGQNTASAAADASSYAVDVKESANALKNSVAQLSAKGDKSVFNAATANSDDKGVSVKYTGTEKFDDMKVGVTQVAQAQKNEGDKLKADATATANSSSFKITDANGKSRSFFVSVSAKDTNEDVQQKVADKINSAGLDVTASIEKDEKTGQSRLVVSGKTTGEGKDFTVSGEMADNLGINKATQSAQDAVYTINGEEKTSSSNNIKVSDNLSLTLNSKTEKDANVSYSKSNTNGINAVRSLVNNYNALMDTAKNFKDSGASKLENQLKGAADTYATALSRIGITTNENGYLQIDADKMKSAADSGELQKFLESNSEDNANYGFINRLGSIAEKADDPTNYMSQETKNSVNSNSVSNYYNSSYANSNYYINSYINLSNSSLLFDAMF